MGTAATSHAAYTLAFDQESYSVLPGGTVSLRLLLSNTSPSPTGTLETEGLQSGGGRLLLDGGDATVMLNSITVGTGFSAASSTYYPPSAFPVADPSNLAGVLANNDSFTNGVGVGADSVTIATFELTVTGSPGGIVLVSPAELSSNTSFVENVSFDSGANLDLQLDNDYAQATITITPEPASMTFLFGGTVLGLRRRRR